MVRILKYILTELTWCFRKTELPQFLFSQNEALTPAAQNGDEPKHLPKLHCFSTVSRKRCWFHQHLLLLFPFSLLVCHRHHLEGEISNVNMLVEPARMGISHGFSVVFSPFQKKHIKYGYVWLASRSHFPHPTRWSHDRLSGNHRWNVTGNPLEFTPESPMDCYLYDLIYVYNVGICCNSKGGYVILSLSHNQAGFWGKHTAKTTARLQHSTNNIDFSAEWLNGSWKLSNILNINTRK